MKIIDDNLMNGLAEEAKKSPRLRKNYNFHQSLQDKCHLEPSVLLECKAGPFVEHDVDGILETKPAKDIYLAGGCFWGTEHYFKQIEGVAITEVGFANGHTENQHAASAIPPCVAVFLYGLAALHGGHAVLALAGEVEIVLRPEAGAAGDILGRQVGVAQQRVERAQAVLHLELERAHAGQCEGERIEVAGAQSFVALAEGRHVGAAVRDVRHPLVENLHAGQVAGLRRQQWVQNRLRGSILC